MKILPQSLVRKKFLYEQIKRSDKAALYSQKDNGVLIGYEVFKVRQLKGYILAGITFEESEPFPHDEAFGLWAWAVSASDNQERALERAESIYTRLNTQVNENDL